MRIPQYDNKVNAPNAPQFNNTVDLRNDSLSALADSLGEVQQVMMKEKEEAQKTAFFQADTSIKMELATAKHDLLEKIKNGGSYADAEAQYQKAHDATIAKYSSVYDQDKSGNTKLRAMAEYQAEGLQNVMQIRDTATSRRRSDTVSSANIRDKQLRREYAFAETPEQRQAVLSKMTDNTAKLTSTGIITGVEGKSRITDSIQGAEDDRLTLFRQNNANNPKAVLDEVERSKNNLSVDAYIKHRGESLNDIDTLGNTQAVNDFMAVDGNNTTSVARPKQTDIDKYFQDNIAPIQDPIEYSASVINLAQKTGQMPSQIVRQASAYFNVDPVGASQSDLQTAETLADIITEASASATLKNSDLPADVVAKAKIIKSRVDSGIPVSRALEDMQKATSGGDYEERYKTGMREANKIILQGKLGKKRVEADIPKWAASQFSQSYSIARSEGSTTSEAVDIAEKEVTSNFREFNGKKFQEPVTMFEPYDEKTWVGIANKALSDKGIEKQDDTVIGVVADATTKKQIAKREQPSYALVQYNGENLPPTVILKNGNVIRVKANPSLKKTEAFQLYGEDMKNVPFGSSQ